MVDGEEMVMMMAMISSNSPSRQGARTEFLVLFRGIWWWRRNGTPFGKTSNPPEFLGQKASYRRRGRPRGCLGRPDHPLARPGPARVARWCGWAPAPLRLIFWLRESSGEIGFLAFVKSNFENIHFLTFLEPKTAENMQLALLLLLIG